jgi:serine/threonine protein kinase
MNDPQTQPPASASITISTGQAASALAPGSRLGTFEIQRVVSRSASTVVYLASDHALDITVAIQEYLPGRFVQRDAGQQLHALQPWHEEVIGRGLRAFVAEARMLARCDHPSLVRVSALIETHGTAYRVMPLYEGQRLVDLRRDMRIAPDEASLRVLLDGLLGALEAIHRTGHVHGGVAPANILLLSDDRPLLLGPGAADREIASDLVESLMAGLESSFAPPDSARRLAAEADPQLNGVWGDLFALAEVVRFCITGELPAASGARREREALASTIARKFEPASQPRYSAAFLSTLDAATSQAAADRPHSAAQFRDWLDSGVARKPKPAVMPVEAAAEVPVRVAPTLSRANEPTLAPTPMPTPTPIAKPKPTPTPTPTLTRTPIPPPPPPPPPLFVPSAAAATESSLLSERPTSWPDLPDVASMTADRAPWGPDPLTPKRTWSAAARRRWRIALIGGALVLVGLGIVAVASGGWDWIGVMRQARFTQAATQSVTAAPPPEPAPAVVTPAPPEPAAPVVTSAPPPAPREEAAPVAAVAAVVASAASAPLDPAPVTPAAPLVTDEAPPRLASADPAAALTSTAPKAESAPLAASAASPPPPPPPPAPRPATTLARAPQPVAKPPVKPAPKPAPKLAPKPAAQAAQPGSPRAACAPRTEFALYRCMQTQCRSAKWSAHPQCVRLRSADEIN